VIKLDHNWNCHAGSRTDVRTDVRTTFPKLFSETSFQERDFKFSFTWYPTDIILCLWSGFIYPRIRTLVAKLFHCVFSKKKAVKSGGFVSRSFVIKMKLRSTSSAEHIFPDEITWITWKTEIWPFLKSGSEFELRKVVQNSVLLPASLGINSPGGMNSNYYNEGHREGTHRLFAVYKSWPASLFASCFSGESFCTDPIWCFRDDCLSTVGAADSNGCRCQMWQSQGKPSFVAITGRRYVKAYAMQKFVAITSAHHSVHPLALTVSRYKILRVLSRLFWYYFEAWTPPGG